jgi:thiol-disulfide isomerase/thioredoxin
MRIAMSVLLCAAMGLAQAPKQAPRKAPPLSVQRPNAPPLPLSQYRGKVLALTFISTVCSHCQALTLQLNQLAVEFAPRGVQFVECAINDGAESGLIAFTTKFQPAFPVGWATPEAMMSYLGSSPMDLHATFVPHMVFVDRLGVMRDNFEPGSEFYSNPPVNIRAELEKLLKR